MKIFFKIFTFITIVMKKTLLSLASLVLVSGMFGSHVNALELLISDLIVNWTPLVDDAYVQMLNNYDNTWWYLDSSSLACNNESGISVSSSIVEDGFIEPTEIYRLFVSPYRIEQLRSWDSSVDLSKIISKELVINGDENEVKFDISSADVDPDTAYYGFILPIDEYDQIWTPSKEFCFQLNQNLCMLDYECDTFDLVVNPVSNPEPVNTGNVETSEEEWTELHGAACVGMDLAHISHSSDGKNITLTWTAVDGDTVDIHVLNPDEEIYEKLATVKMSDEKYVYPMRWNWVHEFMFTNDCGTAKYKADEGIKEEEKKPEIVTPATWPAENILYIAIAAIVLYGAYVVFFRKSEN